MKVTTSYKIKIKHFNKLFAPTLDVYRKAVNFFIDVILKEWESIEPLKGSLRRAGYVERITHATKTRPSVAYDFDSAREEFNKFPVGLRRSAVAQALGKVSSYKSNLANYEEDPENYCEPGKPQAGFVYPGLYNGVMFIRTGTYTARIKIFRNNAWEWVNVELNKGNVDYVIHHLQDCECSAPTLTKKGKEWFLMFAYTDECKLKEIDKYAKKILAVKQGINNACVCSVMTDDGKIIDRKFLSLPKEESDLNHTLNRIKKAQRLGARSPKALWAKANGINKRISQLTASCVMNMAIYNNVDVIVFENLDTGGKKHGSKKQRLALWKKQYVQDITTTKAHRHGIRITTVNGANTSKLAFDGSGKVQRGSGPNYSMCTFTSGKKYSNDLNACYNIGARYFIREKLKSLSEKKRLSVEANVPQCLKRSTCTLSDLINLNAAIAAL